MYDIPNMLIIHRIHLNPKYLNSDIYKSLLDELRERTKKECTSEHGHIINIEGITRIIGGFNVSSINCDIICDVEFKAETLKPKVNDEYDGVVCAILPKAGILMEVKNCLKVLVKSDSLGDYVYENSGNRYIHLTEKSKRINIGDIVHVKIRGVKYTDHKFCCFGDFVEI